MHKISVFRAVLITLLGLLWATGGVAAAPPAQGPSDEVSAQVAVSTAFTYQGNLTDGSTPPNPLSGSYDFEFKLYDALSGGSQVGNPVLRTIAVTAGLFSVELDFGNVFDGTALWLEISVQPAGILSPRQPLTATPYAIYALNVPTHDHWGETWTGGSGTGLTLSGGTTGLFANGSNIGVNGQSDTTTGIGVLGWASDASGDNAGVEGVSESAAGKGLYGYALATSGTTYGVYGKSAAPYSSGGLEKGYGVYGEGSGAGVWGQAVGNVTHPQTGVLGTASDTSQGTGVKGTGGYQGVSGTGGTYGVYGTSNGTSASGVYGYASDSTGTNYGVYGTSASSSGRGVYGTATAYGVIGESTNGRGVQGTSTNNVGVQGNGGTYGVFGGTSTGKGVNGFADATTGLNYGVYGQSKSASGIGVYGYASDANVGGTNYGVYGQSLSANGRGVYGSAPTYGVQGVATSGGSTTNYGVWGKSSSSNGRAVYGENTAGGYAGYFNGHVYVGSSKSYSLGYGFLNSNGNTGTSSGTNPYSIYASNYIAAQEFNAFSDARIKNIQGQSDGAADLATLSQIEITDYTLKDVIAKGSDPVKKVIGQQVEAVYPQAVNRSTDVVPDIYQKAPIRAGWVEIATDLQPGERVRLIGEETEGVYDVLEVTPDGFRTDFVADGKAVFVYGREVNDFRNVDYEAIAMLNVSATQELNRQVEQQAAEIEALTTRLAALEQTMNSGNTAASSPMSPWWLFGGLGVVGLVAAQRRRAG